jgi:hypothetical protein
LTTTWAGSVDEDFGNTAITDAGFTDATISAGFSKTFIVKMDTQDAGTTDKLSIYVDTADVTWEDSSNALATSDIVEVPHSLPLEAKTMSY